MIKKGFKNDLLVIAFFFFLLIFGGIVFGYYHSLHSLSYEDRMKSFVEAIRKHTSKERIIITQNGSQLYFKQNGKIDHHFVNLVNGTTQEELSFGADFTLNNPSSNKVKKIELKRLKKIRKTGKMVFPIDYSNNSKQKAKIKVENAKNHFVGEALPHFEANTLYTPINGYTNRSLISFSNARNFLCLLNPEKFKTAKDYVSQLEKTDYDILFIDVSFNGHFLSKKQINALKKKQSGGRRYVIAYLSIGEAEDYRYYWKKSWTKNHLPSWIVKENSNWKGDYIVKYWSPAWQRIVFNYQHKLDQIGVDGYLLDTVESYQYFANK